MGRSLTSPLEKKARKRRYAQQPWMLLEGSLKMKLHGWEQIQENHKWGQSHDATILEVDPLWTSKLHEPTFFVTVKNS